MKFLKIIFFFFFLIFFDFLFIFFFKNLFPSQKLFYSNYWRIPSSIYHHDLLANISVNEKWGSDSYLLVTNSIGFRDYENKNIKKINQDQKRILVLGDSFTEGLINYEDSFVGLLQKKYKNKYEILNGGVGSYSPTNYYYKFKHYIENGYKFDQVIIFLDVSDIVDETRYNYDIKNNLILKENFSKNNDYINSLKNYSIIFKSISFLRDQFKYVKNYIRYKYRAAKAFNKNFFEISHADIKFYRMINNEIGLWTENINEARYNLKTVNIGIKRAEMNLLRISKLAQMNNCEFTLIIYPWPTQVYFGDKIHSSYWENFANTNDIKFINLYDAILDKKKEAKDIIMDNYIHGDIHFNKKGNIKIFNDLIKKLEGF